MKTGILLAFIAALVMTFQNHLINRNLKKAEEDLKAKEEQRRKAFEACLKEGETLLVMCPAKVDGDKKGHCAVTSGGIILGTQAWIVSFAGSGIKGIRYLDKKGEDIDPRGDVSSIMIRADKSHTVVATSEEFRGVVDALMKASWK